MPTTIGSLVKLNDDSKTQGVITAMTLKTVNRENTIVYTILLTSGLVQHYTEKDFKASGEMPLAFIQARISNTGRYSGVNMTEDGKKKISEAQKKRWAKNRARGEEVVQVIESV